MNPKITNFVRHYFFGLLTSSWNGAIAAVAGILGIDAVALSGVDHAVDAASQTARVLNVHEMLSAFVGAFVLHAIIYFKSHPLPDTFDTNPPIPVPPVPPVS